MKETIAAIIIFSAFAVISLSTTSFTEKTAKELQNHAFKVEGAINTDNWELAVNETKKAREIFVEKSPVLESYLLHDDIEFLSDVLSNIESAVSQKDKTAGCASIKIFLRRLSELSESDRLTLNNIL